MNKDNRKEFEKWAKSHFGANLSKNKKGAYKDIATLLLENCWLTAQGVVLKRIEVRLIGSPTEECDE